MIIYEKSSDYCEQLLTKESYGYADKCTITTSDFVGGSFVLASWVLLIILIVGAIRAMPKKAGH